METGAIPVRARRRVAHQNKMHILPGAASRGQVIEKTTKFLEKADMHSAKSKYFSAAKSQL